MKKVSVVVGIIGFIAILGVIGCSDKAKSPQDVAKSYINEKFKSETCNLENLDYKLIEEQEGAVKVKIKGEIKYEEVISLIKQGDEWVMGTADAAATTEKSHDTVEAAPAPVQEATSHETPAPEAAHH